MLKDRILTAVVAGVLLVLVLFVAPPWLARLTIVATILTAAWEWGGFVAPGATAGRVAYAAALGVALALLYAALLAGVVAGPAVLAVALAGWCAALAWLFFYPTPVPRWLAAGAGALVLLPAWLAIDLLYARSAELLMFLLVIVWSADIGAYFAGRRLGRVKLAPQVSPGKTWEGVFGGLLLVLAVAAAGSAWFGVAAATLLPFCTAVALTSIVGDLTVSAFKRAVGLKDSGRLFPGHGGLLDRIDSVTAAAPLFALGAAWAGL